MFFFEAGALVTLRIRTDIGSKSVMIIYLHSSFLS